MEKRRSLRKKVRIEASLILEGESFSGAIENVSQHGIYLETDSREILSISKRFNPGTEYEVRFCVPSGQEVRLRCKVAWSYRAEPHGLTKHIGMDVIFPPPDYIDFCNEKTDSSAD
ncbi:MAG: PilZ domain-containing protein [Nitrospirota bacterium]